MDVQRRKPTPHDVEIEILNDWLLIPVLELGYYFVVVVDFKMVTALPTTRLKWKSNCRQKVQVLNKLAINTCKLLTVGRVGLIFVGRASSES